MALKAIKLPTPVDTGNFSAIDPLDSRYYDVEVAKHFSEATRITYQAYVEAALAHTLADYNICSPAIASRIESASRKVTAEAVQLEEKATKHDIKALVNCIKGGLDSEAQPYVHFGATSYDIVATASALQMRDAIDQLVAPKLAALIRTLIKLTKTHAETLQIGRTHGQHAVPITFGFALSQYVSRLGSSLLAIQDLSNALPGKFSGAVGAYNALSVFVGDPLTFEKDVLAKLDLRAAPASTQIVPAEHMVRLLDELAITASIMANLANDMRHLQRSEISEIYERFEKGQTGSSTMAHKRNPINFENVVSMSKQVTAQVVNAYLNISSEHQRDLTDSASARFYTLVPASVVAMADRLNRAMSKLSVDSAHMQRNLHLSEGAIAAEPLYLLFAKYGHTAAHEKAKELSHYALTHSLPLVDVIAKDKEATAYWQRFSDSERAIISEPEKYYSGLAATKAKSIARYWSPRI